jgi:hypothetical protein
MYSIPEYKDILTFFGFTSSMQFCFDIESKQEVMYIFRFDIESGWNLKPKNEKFSSFKQNIVETTYIFENLRN